MSTTERTGRLRVVIVDDEEPARRLLRELLDAMPDVIVAAECRNGFEAVKAATELEPDLLLLDIQMPKLDGFEVLELLDQEIAVIFVTAYDEHALRAFEVHAVDYLLKPFSADRLEQALHRARGRLSARPDAQSLASAARPELGSLERILVRSGSEVQVVPVATVDYIEATGDSVSIHAAGATHHKPQPLAALEARLDPGRFMRVHRSFILNIDRLRRLELYAKNSYLAVLADGAKIPISRAGYARLRELL